MSITAIIIITIAMGSIVSSLFVLKKYVQKVDLTAEQLASIKERNEAIDKQEESERH